MCYSKIQQHQSNTHIHSRSYTHTIKPILMYSMSHHMLRFNPIQSIQTHSTPTILYILSIHNTSLNIQVGSHCITLHCIICFVDDNTLYKIGLNLDSIPFNSVTLFYCNTLHINHLILQFNRLHYIILYLLVHININQYYLTHWKLYMHVYIYIYIICTPHSILLNPIVNIIYYHMIHNIHHQQPVYGN